MKKIILAILILCVCCSVACSDDANGVVSFSTIPTTESTLPYYMDPNYWYTESTYPNPQKEDIPYIVEEGSIDDWWLIPYPDSQACAAYTSMQVFNKNRPLQTKEAAQQFSEDLLLELRTRHRAYTLVSSQIVYYPASNAVLFYYYDFAMEETDQRTTEGYVSSQVHRYSIFTVNAEDGSFVTVSRLD